VTPSVSLPGLTGQSSTHRRRLLDRPVKPGDDREVWNQRLLKTSWRRRMMAVLRVVLSESSAPFGTGAKKQQGGSS
jgi:hypothetical protein